MILSRNLCKGLGWIVPNRHTSILGHARFIRGNVIGMWPKARQFGFRYYWDYDFRNRSRKREKNRRMKRVYGAGFISSRHTHRKRLTERDGWRCKMCGSTKALEIDHVLPVSMNGTNHLSNLQLLCHKCHVLKTRQDVRQARDPRIWKDGKLSD